jgi:hypothetical protein
MELFNEDIYVFTPISNGALFDTTLDMVKKTAPLLRRFYNIYNV